MVGIRVCIAVEGGQMDHFHSGLEQGSVLACVVPLGELEQDASWGRRILPPELTQSLDTEPDA